jgi:hypothetical protein
MIAFGVLERLGEHGRVVFADISKDLLGTAAPWRK